MNQQIFDPQLFAELFDVQPQAIIWFMPIRDPAGQVVDFEFAYSNDEGLRYLNIDRRQLGGLRFSTTPTVTEPLRTEFLAELQYVLETGNKVERNVFNPALNKYARVLRTRLREGVLSVVQDRTEEQRMIHELEERTNQLELQKTLLDNVLTYSPAGISVTQAIRDQSGQVIDGRTILANNLALEYLGLNKADYLRLTVRELDPNFLESPLHQMAVNTLQTGKPFYTQYYFEPAGHWLELSVAKMDDNHLINVFMDVTATKEAQLRQQKLLDELQRSNENLEEFAYAASHDLKEPIRKVLFFSDRLRHHLAGKLEEDDNRMFGRMEAATRRMGTLIDDLLNYSQVSQRPALMHEVDLNVLMQTILEDLELQITERKAQVKIKPLPTVFGHQRQLQQLFQNLMSNALKYALPDVPPEVLVCSTTVTGAETPLKLGPDELQKLFYIIEVKDNGIGFEQADAERIFNVFQRLHTNIEYRGTGVGLAIARKVASNHGGYIRAESTPGAGASFKVYLPVDGDLHRR